MKRLKRRLHKESAIHRHDSDTDIPVTEQEKLLCDYISDEIEQQFQELGLTCGCNWHNPGEEQHIEIYIGIPEEEDSTDPKYDNIENDLELLVNKIGGEENEGEKWGDASFQWISDEEIFGELWPIDEQGRGIGRGKYAESKRFGKKFKESSDGGKARIERLCTNLEKQYDTLTYDEIEGKLKKAGFVLDEYGGKTNAYAVFVHDCGIVVNLEYQFVKDYGTRDSWHAANVTYFGWYDDPEYQRWSTESTNKFGKKFKESEEGDFDDMEKEFSYLGVTITRYDYESLPLPMAASKCSDRTMQAIAKDIQEDLVALGWSPKEIRKYLSDVDNYDYDQDDTADRIKSDFWEYMEKAAVSRGMKYYEELDDEDTGY